MAPTSPTVASWALGLRLREKREELGLTGAIAGKKAGIAPTYLSDVEHGKKKLAEDRLEGLIATYELAEDEAIDLRSLREQANERGWWSAYSGLFSDELLRFFGYEHGAASIRTYDGGLIHGLLQTEEYARAIIQAGSPNVRLAEADRRVKARVMRQRRLTDGDPLRLTAVMSEAAIRQEVGGRGVLAAQLDHIIDLGERLRCTLEIRIVPFTSLGHHAMGGSTFHLVTFPRNDLPVLVWQETVTSTEVITDSIRVHEYSIALDEAVKTALDHDESIALMAEARRTLS